MEYSDDIFDPEEMERYGFDPHIAADLRRWAKITRIMRQLRRTKQPDYSADELAFGAPAIEASLPEFEIPELPVETD
jgi:hypothetical protein